MGLIYAKGSLMDAILVKNKAGYGITRIGFDDWN
jgi:hypothetical protein